MQYPKKATLPGFYFNTGASQFFTDFSHDPGIWIEKRENPRLI